jgi:hypothetical protein
LVGGGYNGGTWMGADDDLVPVHEMVHGPDRRQRVLGEDDAPERDVAQQPHRLLPSEFTEAPG